MGVRAVVLLASTFAAGVVAACGASSMNGQSSVITSKAELTTVTTRGQTVTLKCFTGGSGTNVNDYRFGECDTVGSIAIRMRDLRIFDPAGGVRTLLTLADLVTSSARAWRDPSGSSSLLLTFTSVGRAKFCVLTRALAERGANVGVPQRMAFEVGGHVYAQPTVDFKASPHGLCGSPGLQIYLPAPVAQRLARIIRG